MRVGLALRRGSLRRLLGESGRRDLNLEDAMAFPLSID